MYLVKDVEVEIVYQETNDGSVSGERNIWTERKVEKRPDTGEIFRHENTLILNDLYYRDGEVITPCDAMYNGRVGVSGA